MNEPDARSVVRIELDGSGDATPVAPAAPTPTTQPIALILLLAGLVVGFLGLLAVSGDPVPEDETTSEQSPRPTVGDLELSQEDRVWISDVPLFSVVVEGIDGWYAVSGSRLYTADGPTGWERVEVGVDRVLDVSASGDGINVLTAAASRPGPETQLQVLRSTDGEFWKVFDEATVPAVVHSGSLNGTSWSVFAGPSAQPAGEDATVFDQVADRLWAPGDGGMLPLRLAENEWVRGHIAAADGAVAISQTVDFFSTPSGIDLPTRLLRLTPTEAVDITPPDADLTADDRLVRSGDGTLWLISGLKAWSSTAPFDEWRFYGDATGLGNVNRIDPVLNGGGLLASLDRPDTGGFWFTPGDGRWQEFNFPGVSELGVLLVSDDQLTVSAVVDGTRPVTIVRSIDRGRIPELAQLPGTAAAGQVPAIAVADDGEGFVGLLGVEGGSGWSTSVDGLRWDVTVPTNLPAEFVPRRLVRVDGGWMTYGTLGEQGDAVYANPDGDGLDWTPWKLGLLPGDASTMEILGVSGTDSAFAVFGSLGWEDDDSRSEPVVFWLPRSSGDPIVVPPRPCPDPEPDCTILSLVVLADGVLVTHSVEDQLAVSRWSQDEGWTQQVSDERVSAGAFALVRDRTDIIYLGQQRVLRSDTGGFWFEVFGEEVGVGPYVAISPDSSVAVAWTPDARIVRSAGGSVSYAAPGLEFGPVVAVSADAAIVEATTAEGLVLARLEALDAADLG